MATKRQRIRIFFVNCPRLDWLACSYLLLAQNTKQELFEFEIYHFWNYADEIKKDSIDWGTKFLKFWGESRLPLRKAAFKRYVARLDRICEPFLSATLPLDRIIELVGGAIEGHDEWLFKLPRSYGGWSIEPAPTIVITETPFFGGYYGWADNGLGVISVATWEKRYAPPSVLEYVLRNVQRYSLKLAFDGEFGSHYPTRACTWDFNATLVDIGAGIMIGYLCSACEEGLQPVIGKPALEGVRKWLSLEWVGRVDEPGSVASNIKRVFGYDLARTKGLTRGFWDRLLETLTSESAKLILSFLLGALASRFLGGGNPSSQPTPKPPPPLLS